MTDVTNGANAENSEAATAREGESIAPGIEGQVGEGSPLEEAEAEVVDPLQEAQSQAVQLKDKLMRMAADFDNYRKRSRREVSDAEKKGRESLLNDLLPVFDNLERATAHADSVNQGAGAGDSSEDPKLKGLIDGISLVTRQFQDVLARIGVERVESVGKPFDPSLHEAIQHLETTEFPPGCIAAEVQSGYRQGERLVRAALVVVAKAPQIVSPSDDSEG